MTNVYSNSPFVPLLPKLKQESDVRADKTTGEWTPHPETAFQNVASSLHYHAPGQLKSISSVPTMWARPLTMEMALHNPGHPIREYMVAQWQGMLAVIAFAAMHAYPLKVKSLQLEKFHQPFVRSLIGLLPEPSNALYDYREKGDRHPWRDIYLFFWNNKPVGMTTPSTLVVPAEEADWQGLRWWKNGVLQAPQDFLSQEEKVLLWQWLDHLLKELDPEKYKGNVNAINTIARLIEEFKASLLPAPPLPSLVLSDNLEFFDTPLNRGVLAGLNRPLKAPDRPSSVRVVPSQGKQPTRDLILIDPKIASKWGERPENIRVHRDKTLATLNLENLRANRLPWDDVYWREPEDLFLPELTFIDHVPDAIPGGLLPAEMPSLTLAGEGITPLLPIHPILLEYLTPEDLSSRIRFQASGVDEVRVTLDLPLSGTREGTAAMNYRLTQTYSLKKENALAGVPVLEVWPNLRSPDWHEYYVFYHDAGFGKDTFQAEFPESKKTTLFKDSLGGIYQMVCLEQFPSVIQCQNDVNQIIGLILPKQPNQVFPNASWKVGVDFGTSFTNVYVGRGGLANPLSLENLHLKVTESQRETRFPALIEYFIPENFLPTEKPLPLSSVLTTRGSNSSRGGQGTRPIFDGRIYVPQALKFDSNAEWIETDLKWSNFSSNRLFLKHLILHISATAVKQGVNQIHWSLSFPSAFSRNDRNAYAKAWNDLTHELGPCTGIAYECSNDPNSDHFRTESLAVAQYFADQERHDLVYSTCIDMGGGTSDISIWEDNKLIHQCSVQLAGRNLLSKFLELNPQFIAQRFGINPNDWRGLRDGAFNAKLDVLLRWESETWLKEKLPTFSNEEDVQGLTRLMAIGIAGLYYYVGILLRVLNEKGRYGREKITPVYLGGNGSRLLHWLDSTGHFARHSEVNDLLSRMLSRGSGFDDTEEPTRLSQNPKDEVACGLVLDVTRLQGLDRRTKDPVIAGETCELNGMPVSWDDYLEIEEDVQSFRIPTFSRLSMFLYDFHVALRELSIEGIRPLKDYKRSREVPDNSKLWNGTRRALDKLLQESNLQGDAGRIRVEPPFILCLKALLNHLGNEWTGR